MLVRLRGKTETRPNHRNEDIASEPRDVQKRNHVISLERETIIYSSLQIHGFTFLFLAYTCAPECLSYGGVRRGTDPLKQILTNGCELSSRRCEPSSGPLQKQLVL